MAAQEEGEADLATHLAVGAQQVLLRVRAQQVLLALLVVVCLQRLPVLEHLVVDSVRLLDRLRRQSLSAEMARSTP